MLKIEKLKFKISNNEILNIHNIIFPSHGLIGIYGESGCGKTTLLYCLFKKLKYEGHIDYDKDCHISMIKQNKDLIPYLKIKDNLLLECYYKNIEYKQEVYLKIIEKLNIKKLLNKYPHEISCGEAKRVTIARCLLSKSSIILCDEPTGALNSYYQKEVMKLLKLISKYTLVIIVSHQKDLLNKYCHKLYHLENKTLKLIKDIDTHGYLLNKTYKKYNHYEDIYMLLSQRKKLILTVIFEILLLLSLLIIVNLSENINNNINDYYNHHALKDMYTIEKIDQSSFMKPKDAYYYMLYDKGYLKYDAKMYTLPLNNKHIKLNTGRLPKFSNEVLVSYQYYKKYPSSKIIYTLDKEYIFYITGVLKEDFKNEKEIYFHYNFTLKNKSYCSEYTYLTNKKIKGNYILVNDIQLEKESYQSIFNIFNTIRNIYILLCFIIMFIFTKGIYDIKYIEEKHTLALMISYGREYKSICKMLLSTGLIFSLFISICVMILYIHYFIVSINIFYKETLYSLHILLFKEVFLLIIIFIIIHVVINLLQYIKFKKESLIDILREVN